MQSWATPGVVRLILWVLSYPDAARGRIDTKIQHTSDRPFQRLFTGIRHLACCPPRDMAVRSDEQSAVKLRSRYGKPIATSSGFTVDSYHLKGGRLPEDFARDFFPASRFTADE